MNAELNDGKMFICCPGCGVRFLRTGDAEMEVYCKNNKCRAKWNVTVKGCNVEYQRIENITKPA